MKTIMDKNGNLISPCAGCYVKLNEDKTECKTYVCHKLPFYLAKQRESGIDTDVEVKSKWTTDRKPEVGNNYIISVWDDSGDSPIEYVTYGLYVGNSCWVVDNDILHHSVIAYMKLPQPYVNVAFAHPENMLSVSDLQPLADKYSKIVSDIQGKLTDNKHIGSETYYRHKLSLYTELLEILQNLMK